MRGRSVPARERRGQFNWALKLQHMVQNMFCMNPCVNMGTDPNYVCVTTNDHAGYPGLCCSWGHDNLVTCTANSDHGTDWAQVVTRRHNWFHGLPAARVEVITTRYSPAPEVTLVPESHAATGAIQIGVVCTDPEGYRDFQAAAEQQVHGPKTALDCVDVLDSCYHQSQCSSLRSGLKPEAMSEFMGSPWSRRLGYPGQKLRAMVTL